MFGRTETKFSTSFNKKQSVICTKMMHNCKPVGNSSINDTNRYVHLDNLKKKLFNENPYTLVDLTDEVMGISKVNIPDRIKRSNARAKFVIGLGSNFPIVLSV